MVIIFYDANTEEIYICSSKEKMKRISIDDPDILFHIPNDDLLYVSNAHFITKRQFGDWLDGNMKLSDFNDNVENVSNIHNEEPEEEFKEYIGKRFIHPVRNGAILISDISTPKYPEGIELIGKHTFICIDDLGGEEGLEASMHYRHLLAKGKIEVVDYDYWKKHKDMGSKQSQRDAELKRILIPSDARGSAEAVAAAGGIEGMAESSGTDSVEILIET